MSQFDVDAFCNVTTGDVGRAICAVNHDLQGVKLGLNTFFLIFAGALVFMMQTGFAMFCAGSIRAKNVKSTMLKNLLNACIAAIGFYTIGFAVAYGGDQTGLTFVGNGNFALRNYEGDYAYFFFEFTLAATAATIIAGAIAERSKMIAYLSYSFLLTGFVYPVVVHSIWDNNGFLSPFAAQGDRFRGIGAIDYAGSGVVHMVGGVTSLIAVVVLGPRRGRFHDDDGNVLEEPVAFPSHSVSLQILGTFLLWFGWYGFTAGSANRIDNVTFREVAALCAVTTTMAAASGCVTAMFVDSILDSMYTGETSYDIKMAMNGTLSGLVAITAGCAVVTPWAAIIIGAVGGVVYISGSRALIRWRIDDAVDAIPVHLCNGAWGVLAVGLFAKSDLMETAGYSTLHQGWFYEWGNHSVDANLLLAQICAICFIVGWVGAIMTPFFLVLNRVGMFRVAKLEEEVGLDISAHRGAAYDLTGAKKEHIEELMEVRASRHARVELPREVSPSTEL